MARPEKTFRMGLVSASVFVNEFKVGDGNRKADNTCGNETAITSN